MKIYLFTRTDTQTRPLFRVHYIFQNLKVIKDLSLMYFTVVLFVRIATLFLKVDLDGIVRISNFSNSFYVSLYTMPIFYIGSRLLINNFKPKNSFLILYQLMVIVFSIFIISRGMLNTFYAVHNPRNSITMYLLWLFVVSIFFVFEYYETLFIAAVSLTMFTLLLPYYQPDAGEIVKNEFVILMLLVMFFVISRHVFSYRASHYIQLKTIREKNIQIENTNHLKDEILGIVAHDLRNPLAAIESIAMLMELDDDIDDNTRDNLAMIKASCEKTKFIINDLIEVAKNDSVETFGVEKIELNEFLLEIINHWIQSKTGEVKLIFVGTKQPVYTWINKEKMQRVMDNLISNAIKFSGDGNRIEVLLKQIDEKCSIKVKDSGLGIPDDMLPYIFDRFSKAGRKGVRGEDSIGLGLSIVRQIIRKHGGDITVESIVQKGTTFTVVLPLVQIQSQAQSSELVPAG